MPVVFSDVVYKGVDGIATFGDRMGKTVIIGTIEKFTMKRFDL